MKINIQGILKHLIFAIFFILIPISVYTQDNPNKKEALIYYNYGLSSDQLGNYDRAIENFLKAYQLDSSYNDIFKLIGLSYIKASKYKEAIPYFEKAIEVKPDTSESYMNMGNAYYALKDYEKAIHYYEKAIEIDPELKSAYRNMGNAYSS